MHHPGPPRFTAVGEPVELAPRAPDPDGAFAWSLADAPADSAATLGDGAVVELAPDAPGTYRARLDAPDGTHEQVVRVFPDERRETTVSVPLSELGADEPAPVGTTTRAATDRFTDGDELPVLGPFNEFVYGEESATFDADAGAFRFSTVHPPGRFLYVVGSGSVADARFGIHRVDGPGRPVVTLSASRDESEDAVVVSADASAAPGSTHDDADLDVEFHLDGRDALDRGDVTVADRELRVPLAALPEEGARIHAVAVGDRHSVADELDLSGTAGDPAPGDDTGPAGDPAPLDDPAAATVASARPNAPPEWVHDATVYEVFVRSFAGDDVEPTFGELERRVSYLAWLGVDCVWLTPVLASPTEHGYHTTDYFDTAADLGSREAFESLVETLHDAGIRVVFDLVLNHAAKSHPAFQQCAAGVPEYADWYETDEAGLPRHYYDWSDIPNFDFTTLGVREHLLAAVAEWAPLVDGFRCDVAWGVPRGFWLEVRDLVREVGGADTLLLDETIPRDPKYHEAGFGVHYDTTLYDTLQAVGKGDLPADAVRETAGDARATGFPPDAAHLLYAENHDTPRYRSAYGDGALRAAVAATFTLPGVPMLYYGQERGMTDRRGPMKWHDGNDDLTEYHRQLIRHRDEDPALGNGPVEPVDYETAADTDRVTAYAVGAGDERRVVVLNFDAARHDVDLGVDVDTTDLVTGADVAGEGTELSVREAAVLAVERGE